jgi:hypothetical protein
VLTGQSRLVRITRLEHSPVAAANITKRAVDAANAKQIDSYLWDKNLPGFGLKITPAGRKVYLVQYRIGGRKGRSRRVTIGQHGALTPTAARIQAKRLLGEIAAGRDPAVENDKAKAGKSLAVVLEQFMAEHVRPKLKPSTAEGYQRIARLYVLPPLDATQLGKCSARRLRACITRCAQGPIRLTARSPCSPSFSGGPRSTASGPTAPTHAGISRSTARAGANAS